MRKWLFKIFGETNAFLWFYGLFSFLYLAFFVCFIYVVYHFASKYW
jgi:hypothetical protein